MGALNETEWIISFEIVNDAIVEALKQMYQNLDNEMERANQYSSVENPLQQDLHFNLEIPYDASHRESTSVQLQTESNQEYTSLNQYQAESDDVASIEMSDKIDLCDNNQACATNCDAIKYDDNAHTPNSQVQSDVHEIQSNGHNSNSHPIHLPNDIVEKSIKCEVCNNVFKSKPNLQTHMLIHSGIKPFNCEVCSRSFRQTGTLNRHMLNHSVETPFKCDICNKQFTQQTDVERHMLIHSGEKPHKCHICNRGFTQKGNLKKHILTHKKKKFPKKIN